MYVCNRRIVSHALPLHPNFARLAGWLKELPLVGYCRLDVALPSRRVGLVVRIHPVDCGLVGKIPRWHSCGALLGAGEACANVGGSLTAVAIQVAQVKGTVLLRMWTTHECRFPITTGDVAPCDIANKAPSTLCTRLSSQSDAPAAIEILEVDEIARLHLQQTIPRPASAGRYVGDLAVRRATRAVSSTGIQAQC
eukprot:COSAG06_NODE_768_length_12452_cov_5.484537_10_plen_195_part_00